MLEDKFPNVTAVDEDDEVVGYFQLFDAIAQGLTRRIAAVFVLDEEGHILIQRRSNHVLNPNLLDFSAAGHVDEGDDYLKCAQSELSEELGVTGATLTQIVEPFPTPGYFNGVFKIIVSKDTAFTINQDEVQKVFWVTPLELKEMIAHHPQQFTEPFLAVWAQVRDKIIL